MFKGIKWHKIYACKYFHNKLTLKSAFFADFLYLYAFELYTKLTARRTLVRLRARQNAEKSAFYFVSCILHLNSFSPKRGRCLTQHPPIGIKSILKTIRMRGLPSPAVLTHFGYTACSFPAKLSLCLCRVCVTFCNIARTSWVD